MTIPSALISYPNFKDLEKSNSTFVQVKSNPKKSQRKYHERNKTKLITGSMCSDTNFILNERNSEEKLGRASVPKDVHVLRNNITSEEEPDENDIIESLPSPKEKNVCEMIHSPFNKAKMSQQDVIQEIYNNQGDEGGFTNEISEIRHSNYDTNLIHNKHAKNSQPRKMLKSKFPNHTLVMNNTFINPLTSEKIKNNKQNEGTPDTQKMKHNFINKHCKASVSNEKGKSETSVDHRYTNESRLTITLNSTKYECSGPKCKTENINAERNNLTTKFNEESKTPLNEAPIVPTKALVYKTPNTSKYMPLNQPQNTLKHSRNTSRCSKSTWSIVLVVASACCFVGILAYVAVISYGIEINVTPKPEPVKYEPTRYEIFLLIARNFRRMIVSPIYRIRPIVN